MLRRRVEQRTHELRETMAKLQKETQISATLAERDRLAGEIHDSLEQGLSAIVMQMEAAAKHIDQPERVGRYLTMARNMAGFSRTEVQHAVWDLQSPLLQNADLSTALRRIAEEISAGDVPLVTVEITGKARQLPSSVEHHLLRIGQEAITNAVKHANPKAIRVHLDYGEANLTLTVRDDGCGFDPKTVASGSGHFGLEGLRTRARKLKGELTISSEPGRGTSIEVAVPFANPTAPANTQAS
jgi:signal transduction histidine kinase